MKVIYRSTDTSSGKAPVKRQTKSQLLRERALSLMAKWDRQNEISAAKFFKDER